MSDLSTPLSDVIATIERDPGAYNRFLEIFLDADVGVHAERNHDSSISVAMGSHEDAGSPLLLVYADPPAFAARFGPDFNAQMKGRGALETAAANSNCKGVLVNSATSKTSVVIGRDVVLRLLQREPEKPWWRFW